MDDKIHFDMFITFNDDKTKAYVNIRPNSRIDENDLKTSIIEGFNKIKSSLKMAGITYGILSDKEIIEQLKEYCSLSNEERKSKIFPVVVAKGTLPIDGEDSKLIEHVKLKKELKGKIDEKTGNIDHRDLGFSDRVIPQGKLILTIIKPTKGEPGMNVLGEPLEAKPGEFKHKIKYDKNSIEVEEDEKELRYIAKKEGFLYHDYSKGYFVDEKVLTKAVDFKIGNIRGKEVEDSTVVVQGSSDIFEDSVKADFKVEAKNVKIKGNVGIGAEIKGEKIEIDGIVDKNAKVEGENIKINKCFGAQIKGKIININEISNSKAIGDVVIVNNCLSSEITAKEVVVKNESRGSKIKAEKFIFVNCCYGTIKQELAIDPEALPDTVNEINKLKANLKKIEKEIEVIENQLNSINEKLQPINEKIENILNKYFKYAPGKEKQQKEILKKLFKSGNYEIIEQKFKVEFSTGDVYTIKNYSNYLKKLQKINEDLDALKKEKDLKEENLKKLTTMASNATIVVKNINNSLVIIKFKELEYKFSDDLKSPIVIFMRNNSIRIEELTKEMKKYLSDLFDDLITGESFKIVKRIL